MAVDIKKKIEAVRSGKYSREQLEILRENAASRDGPEVVAACDEMLAKLPKPKSGRSKAIPDSKVAERREHFVITHVALSGDGTPRMPGNILVAEELATKQHVTHVAVLKSQIRLYFKDRRLGAGRRPSGLYWLGCLDEKKLTDGTVECWKGLGEVSKGTYHDDIYVVVEVSELSDLNQALQCVQFT